MESVYLGVASPPQIALTVINAGGLDAFVAVILEVSGVDLNHAIVNDSTASANKPEWDGVHEPLISASTCSTVALVPTTLDGIVSWAASTSTVAAPTFASAGLPGTVYSAAASGANPVRIDVAVIPTTPIGVPTFGTFTYASAQPNACGLALFQSP